jgi:hypothetical protein
MAAKCGFQMKGPLDSDGRDVGAHGRAGCRSVTHIPRNADIPKESPRARTHVFRPLSVGGWPCQTAVATMRHCPATCRPKTSPDGRSGAEALLYQRPRLGLAVCDHRQRQEMAIVQQWAADPFVSWSPAQYECGAFFSMRAAQIAQLAQKGLMRPGVRTNLGYLCRPSKISLQ